MFEADLSVEGVRTMTITIRLSESVERLLADRAAKAGKSIEDVALESIERDVVGGKTMAEIMAPFAAEFAASGMTEEELDALVEEAREEIYREKHGHGSKTR
jgi:hypothetical protein